MRGVSEEVRGAGRDMVARPARLRIGRRLGGPRPRRAGASGEEERAREGRSGPRVPPPTLVRIGRGSGAPPPRARPGLRPRGAWGGRGSRGSLLCLGLGLCAGRRPGMLPPGRCAGLGLWRRDGECAGGREGPASQQAVSLAGGGA